MHVRFDLENLVEEARAVAEELNHSPESIEPLFTNSEGSNFLCLSSEWSREEVPELTRRLEERLNQTSPEPVQTSIREDNHRPYMIHQLNVEGPDNAPFVITDTDSRTPIGDIASTVLSQYDNPAIFKDNRGRPRRTTVDRILPDGSQERLDPEQTLHDANIGENENLSVNTENTAGSLDPQFCEEARARAFAQIKRYAEAHPGFQVQANALHAPTEYLFNFEALSFAPPLEPGHQPRKIDQHSVFLFLPGSFPMNAPEAYWQTEIFHPNINPKNGQVCLGGLGEHYRPGLDFGNLCQLIVDIARFRNYGAEQGFLNDDAHRWTQTEEGRQQIITIGGRTDTEIPEPQVRRLRIKRV